MPYDLTPGPSPFHGEGRIGLGELNPARRLQKVPTPSEELLWARLRNRRFAGLKVRRQHPIGTLVLDFYCPDYKLAVEVDGAVHRNAEGRLRDKSRDELLEELGIATLRVTADEVEARIETVLLRIQQAIESRNRINPPSPFHGEGPEVR